MDGFLEKLKTCGSVWENVSGKTLSAFKSGGEVRYVIAPDSTENIASAVDLLKKCGMPYSILGRGTNTLIPDGGYDGAVILPTALGGVEVLGNLLFAEGGAPLARVAKVACEAGLTGFEFMSGIPGTVGGALIMNAGAYGAETGDKVVEVEVLSCEGVDKLKNSDIDFSYRSSSLAGSGIILKACFSGEYGRRADIADKINRLKELRRKSQPHTPSLGSVFKRYNGISPAVFIDNLGLKGKKIGGAEISRIHANFIVNAGGATTNDYLSLKSFVADEVLKNFGITLESEIGTLGE